MKTIKTVGRRWLVVREESGNVKIDIFLVNRRLATLDLEVQQAEELEQEISEQRRIASK